MGLNVLNKLICAGFAATLAQLAFGLPVPAIVTATSQAEMASPMTGIIAQTPFREGQTFKTNEDLIIFKCDKQLTEQAKEQAVLDKKKTIYQGYKRLKTLKAISQIELMESKADYLEAQALWQLTTHKVADCYVKAPFDGQIVKLYVHAHEHIDTGKPLLDIVNFNDLEIKVIAPSSWLKWLHKDMIFEIAIQETNQKYSAKVLRYNHYIDPVSRTFSIYGKFTTKPKNVTPGMSGQAIFKEAL